MPADVAPCRIVSALGCDLPISRRRSVVLPEPLFNDAPAAPYHWSRSHTTVGRRGKAPLGLEHQLPERSASCICIRRLPDARDAPLAAHALQCRTYPVAGASASMPWRIGLPPASFCQVACCAAPGQPATCAERVIVAAQSIRPPVHLDDARSKSRGRYDRGDEDTEVPL